MNKEYTQAQIEAIKTGTFLGLRVTGLTEDLDVYFNAGEEPTEDLRHRLEKLAATLVCAALPALIDSHLT
jgi:hypothetical protein